MENLKDKWKVDKNIIEELRKKFVLLKKDVQEIEVISCKIRIQRRVFQDVFRVWKKDDKDIFKDLCFKFIEFCIKKQILLHTLNIFGLVDDQLDRGFFDRENLNEAIDWGVIWTPLIDLKNIDFFPLTFFHELGHCWISITPPKNEKEWEVFEVFNDLPAICIYSQMFPPHTRTFRDAVKFRTYAGNSSRKKEVMENPEKLLDELLKDAYGN